MATDNKKNAEAEALYATPVEEPEQGVFSAYANVVHMDWTLYDLRIRFGELMQVANDDSPTWANQHGIVLERAAIRLPWRQAKTLRDLLAGVISNYEVINGELGHIKLPAAPAPPDQKKS